MANGKILDFFFKTGNEWPRYLIMVNYNLILLHLIYFNLILFLNQTLWLAGNIAGFISIFMQYETQIEFFYLRKLVSVCSILMKMFFIY